MARALYKTSETLDLAEALVSEFCQCLECLSGPRALAVLQSAVDPVTAAKRL